MLLAKADVSRRSRLLNRSLLPPSSGFHSVIFCQMLLAKADAFRCDFEVFVSRHHFEPALDRECPRRRKLYRIVGTRSAHIGELLALGWVDAHIIAL